MKPASRKKSTPAKLSSFIYLVDDEEVVLDVTEAMLEPQGFRIKKFADPEQALKSFHKEKTKPELLITDYAMGKMNGLELIEKCKEGSPKLKTLLISGVASAEVQLSAATPADRFLAKPYPPPTLVETVREMLAA
jgi:DNA-binding NtrC family response regulator